MQTLSNSQQNKYPNYGKSDFECPYCKIHSHQDWAETISASNEDGRHLNICRDVDFSACLKCGKTAVWHQAANQTWVLVWPRKNIFGPTPHPDMPEEVREVFEEARSIASNSPRAAAALLRLAAEQLVSAKTEQGIKLNVGIERLAQEQRISPTAQQFADSLRLLGNDTVHAVSEIQDHAPQETIETAFDFLNKLVDDLITGPKQAEGMLQKFPERKRAGIEQRGGKAQNIH